MKALYGYASNTPGARNGRYTDPMLEGQVGNLPGTSKQPFATLSAISPRGLSLLQFEEWDYSGGLSLVLVETGSHFDELGE